MDLGISGRRAIICGSSQGLGLACAQALAAEGVAVVINGRTLAKVESAVQRINAAGAGQAIGVAADISTPEGRQALLAACPEPDILVNNAGGPAPRMFPDSVLSDWEEAFGLNMMAPLLLTQAVLPGMKARGFGRIVNVTSAMVTTPRSHMSISSGVRAGLTAAMKAISFDAARHNVTINNMLPERFDSPRQHYMAEKTAERDSITYEEARRLQVESIAARRLGNPAEFGAACAFICSGLAGYISGQNLHLDGGSYPALI